MNYQEIVDLLGFKEMISAPFEIVEKTRKGFPSNTIDNLAKAYGVSFKELALILRVSERMIKRYRQNKAIPPIISDRIFQLMKIYVRAIEIFNNNEFAIDWLRRPVIALGYRAPVEIMDTFTGIEMVFDILGRIERGVYS